MPGRGRRLPVCDLVAAEFVGDQYPRPTALFLQDFLGEPGCGLTVPLTLDQNVENVPVLVHRSPQIFSDPADGDEHLAEVPRVTGTGCSRRSRRAYSGSNLVHQERIVSYVTSIPRSAIINSTSRNERENR